MTATEILKSMTLDEKLSVLTGVGGAAVKAPERFGLSEKVMLDGPHGLRMDKEKNCAMFPSMCSLASTWNRDSAEKVGSALADDCIERDIDMLIAPGINIKRTPVCGRNFEYLSEDPVLTGELAAAYIRGVQKKGVSACLKHFAVNNQEKYRLTASSETDERTLREIYLSGFEIAVKKGEPLSIMSAYNKLNSVWCSENKYLLTDVLRGEWGFKGFVVSDWGAVHDVVRSIKAGLDLDMPEEPSLSRELKAALASGDITEEEIDRAALNMIGFIMRERTKKGGYDRALQHKIAREAAAEGCVLLKNDGGALPLSAEKYKKIAVLGEFAVHPVINGQGSAEVYPKDEYIDSPLEELRRLLPNCEIKYRECFKTASVPTTMQWPYMNELKDFIADCDIVLVFAGSESSDDSENFDRRTIDLHPNYGLFVSNCVNAGKKTVLVLQSGSAVILGDDSARCDAIVEMWLGGEAAGGGIADVLCGTVNPSGKLPETFPTKLRADMNYPGSDRYIEYGEKLNVGYRYYDSHPEEIAFPFGFGLSYTEFEYSSLTVSPSSDTVKVSLKIKNTGPVDGAEVVEIYVSEPSPSVTKPPKELKAFEKVFLKAGEEKTVSFELTKRDFSYYNVLLRDWVSEKTLYTVMAAASSRDIRLSADVVPLWESPYTSAGSGDAYVGNL